MYTDVRQPGKHAEGLELLVMLLQHCGNNSMVGGLACDGSIAMDGYEFL